MVKRIVSSQLNCWSNYANNTLSGGLNDKIISVDFLEFLFYNMSISIGHFMMTNRPFSLQTQPRFQTKYQVISIALKALRQVIWGKFHFLCDVPQHVTNTSHFDEDILV